MRRTIVALFVAVGAFAVLMPVSCVSGEAEPSAHCETVLGWTLPGFEGGSTGWTAYLVPSAAAVAVFVVVRLLLRRDAGSPTPKN
jgi:hypothetical protein